MGGTTVVMAADALSENKKLKIENLALLKRKEALLERIARTVSTEMFKKTLDFGRKDVGHTDLPKEASDEDRQI